MGVMTAALERFARAGRRPDGDRDPGRVHEVLARSMLIDGFDFVLDLDRSRGSYLYDARDGGATSTCSRSSPPRLWA